MTDHLRTARRLGGPLAALALAACISDPTVEEKGRARTTHIEVPKSFAMVVSEVRNKPSAFYADDAGDATGVPLNATYVSRDTSIAALTADGNIKAGLKVGSTYVVVSDGSVAESTLVNVTANFFPWPDTLRLLPGTTRTVTVRAYDQVGGVRGLSQTEWESLDPSVATVTANGVITATGPGQTSIVARRGNFTSAATVGVAKYPRQLVFKDFGIGPGGICAIEADGTPWCWGQHKPVDATVTDRCGTYPGDATRCTNSPVRLSTLAFGQVVSSKTESGYEGSATSPFALATDGKFYRLGDFGPIPLGDGMQFQSALGGSPNCGVAADAKGYCWGYNANGEMGIGVTQVPIQTSNVPVEVGGGIQWKYFVHAGSMCGLAQDNTAYCWGSNINFETGTGTVGVLACGSGCANTPLPVKGDLKFTQIVAGTVEVCGNVTIGGAPFCWGRNQTDNGAPVRSTVPGNVPLVKLFGNRVICGIDAAGSVYCLRFPNEPLRPAYAFLKLALPWPAKKIITGEKIHCALSATAESRLYCWGTGALGTGTDDVSALSISPAEVWGQRPPT